MKSLILLTLMVFIVICFSSVQCEENESVEKNLINTQSSEPRRRKWGGLWCKENF